MPRHTQRALLGALTSLGGLVIIGLVTFSQTGRSLDESAMRGFVDLHRDWSRPLATPFVGLAGIGPAFVLCAALVMVAVRRGRPRLAALVVFIAGCSAVTTGILKQVAADPRTCDCVADTQIGPGAWPSGHTTMAMALILSAIIVTPARWRPTAAVIGGAVAIAFTYALMVMGWHYPTEVLAGLVVPAVWALAGLAAMWAADARWPERTGREAAVRLGTALAPMAAGLLIAGLVVAAVIALRPESAGEFSEAHTTAVAVGALIAATAGGLAASFALLLRR